VYNGPKDEYWRAHVIMSIMCIILQSTSHIRFNIRNVSITFSFITTMKTTFRRKHLAYDAIKYCSNANRHLIVLPDLLLPRWSCKHSLHFIYRYIIRYPPVLIMAEYDMSVCLLRSLTSYSVTVPETNRASSNI